MNKSHFNQDDRVDEGKITIKRRYTENYPAKTVGKSARIRNKMLEAISDGAITQEEFDSIIAELSSDSKRWLSRNSRLFNITEAGITLTGLGKKILSQITVNEKTEKNPEIWVPGKFDKDVSKLTADELTIDNIKKLSKKHRVFLDDAIAYVEYSFDVDIVENKENNMKTKLVFESFGDFVNSLNKNNEELNEGTRGQFGMIDKKGNIQSVYMHYDSYPENILPLIKKGYRNSKKVQAVIDRGDTSGLDKTVDTMNFYEDGRKPTSGKKADLDRYIKKAADDGGAEYIYLYDESDKTWYMVDVYGDMQLVPAFESVVNEVNENKYAKAGKLGYNDQFLGRQSLSKTLSLDLGLNPKHQFGGGDWLGFDHISLYTSGGKKGGTILDDALSGKYTYDELKAAAADFLGIKESEEALGESEDTELNEAFKSSKLRNLIRMDQAQRDRYGKARNLAAGIYGLSKLKLDKIEDSSLIDVDPKEAYKKYQNNRDYLVFYIVDSDKENEFNKSGYTSMLKPGILALTRGKDFLSVQYVQSRNRSGDRTLGKDDGNAVGGNKRYSGYDASGISSVVRASKLADRAIVIDIVNGGETSKEERNERARAKEGALAFKSDADFKKANKARYQEILATKASKLPLDKMVNDAIDDLGNQIKDGLKANKKTEYGELKIGENSKGRPVKITDASNHMGRILSDYQRYVEYMVKAEEEKGRDYSSGYYEKNSKQYAKDIQVAVKKIPTFDYAW